MIKVILAGNYPEQTYEKLRKLLPEQKFEPVSYTHLDVYKRQALYRVRIQSHVCSRGQ